MIFQNHKKARIGGVLTVFALSLLISACLPESESVQQESDLTRIQSESQFLASNISQFSLQIQNSVTSSALWQSRDLDEGAFASLSASDQADLGLDQMTGPAQGMLAAGYCNLGDAVDENNAFITWFVSEVDDEFIIKGLGREPGIHILSALSQTMSPETIGIHNDDVLTLSGTRSDGSREVSIPGDCALDIPEGAPVVFFEGIQRVTTTAGTELITMFEFETRDCDPGEVGGITIRKEVIFDPVAGTSTPTGVEDPVADTCTTAGDDFTSTINTAAPVSVITGLDLTLAGELAATLGDLGTIDCRETDAPVLGADSDGDGVPDDPSQIITCDTNGDQVEILDGISVPGDTQAVIPVTITRNCGPGSLVPFAASYNGFNGTATAVSGFVGSAVYRRDVDQSTITTFAGSDSELISTVNTEFAWQGQSLNCSRPEELRISCAEIFPAETSDASFVQTSNSGAVLTRTNVIAGFKSDNITPNDGLAPDEGWSLQSINCVWQQQQTFDNCPSGFSPTQTGVNERTISATDVAVLTGGSDPFVNVTPSTCQRVETSGSPCP